MRPVGRKMIIVLAVTVLILIVILRLSVVYKEKIKFFATGLDSSFSLSETAMLWNLASLTEMEEPAALFISLPSLNRAIVRIISDSKRKGTENSPKIQKFLSKLYDFRTKLNLEHAAKTGIDSTKYLDKGQKLRIILPGHGVFVSEIVNNGYEIVIRLPFQNGKHTVSGENWIGKTVSVYLWRKKDAAYVFDTVVTNNGVFNGNSVIYLAHTSELLRNQKRRSVRCQCNIPCAMYFIEREITDFNTVEKDAGYRVIIEDISEDGAMIRVGGRGIVNSQIKLQFNIGEKIILMYGIVRAVEYNKVINQSLLHFECLHIEQEMKNAVLSFVYEIIPQEEKDIFDALHGTEEDMKDENNKENGEVKTESVEITEDKINEPQEGLQ